MCPKKKRNTPHKEIMQELLLVVEHGYATAMAVCPSSHMVAVCSPSRLKVGDLEQRGVWVRDVRAKSGEDARIAWVLIDMRYYVCIVDVCNRVRMFDMSTLELVGQMVLPKARHFTPNIAVHGSVLAAAIGERVYVFDVHIGRLTARKVTLHLLLGCCSLVFSPDGSTLVAGCRYYPGCSLATTREFVVADGSEKAVSSMRLPFQRTSGAFRLHWGGHGRALVSSFKAVYQCLEGSEEGQDTPDAIAPLFSRKNWWKAVAPIPEVGFLVMDGQFLSLYSTPHEVRVVWMTAVVRSRGSGKNV